MPESRPINRGINPSPLCVISPRLRIFNDSIRNFIFENYRFVRARMCAFSLLEFSSRFVGIISILRERCCWNDVSIFIETSDLNDVANMFF